MGHASFLPSNLHVCPACGQPFVAPQELPAPRDGGVHLVDLACANCGWEAVERHVTASLTELQLALHRDSAQIEAAAEVLALALELDRIDRFAAALQAGHILPEDF
ncbi:MAG: hypothetical protein QOI62_868 [Solirubrobacteraceae bacterium]|nr:hypothetical protein [Solirubrobacteraceae bacterium]MEA2357608.1 hypothetical protein [Solirubrobacteraceae bacterium]